MVTMRRGLGRRIGIVLCAIVLVVALIWGVALVQVTLLLPRNAQRDATAGLAAGVAELADLAAADAAILDEEFGEPVGAERRLRCAIHPVDSGWFTSDHRQRCTLIEVEYREVPVGPTDQRLTAAEAAALTLRSVDSWSEGDGATGELLGDDGTCQEVLRSEVDSSGDGHGFPIDDPEADLHAVLVTDPAAVEDCALPYLISARLLDERTITDPSASAPELPDGAVSLVIVRSMKVSSSSLGCLPLPVFCQPPTTSVRMPDSF